LFKLQDISARQQASVHNFLAMDSLEALRAPIKILEIFGFWQTKESLRNYKIYGIIVPIDYKLVSSFDWTF